MCLSIITGTKWVSPETALADGSLPRRGEHRRPMISLDVIELCRKPNNASFA
jgi:hypothetical protein